MDYTKLKSGTDIRGTAMGTKIDLDESAVYDLTAGFVRKLGGKGVIAVGHDSRLTAEKLKNAAIKAIADSGCDYYDCGLASTPAMFMATVFAETKCDGAVMLTASHHPYDKNGMKFFTEKGGLGSGELSEVIALSSDCVMESDRKGKKRDCDLMTLYKEFLKNKFREFTGEESPLIGMKIAVDASNGSGGFFADVLAELGADVSASLNLEPDGKFPNHVPNPEAAEAMKAISDAVKAGGCDLGVIFDTDADRSAIVTSDGKEINRNRLIALMSAIVLKENRGATIVTDSVTSSGLTEFITAHGGIHLRFKRGYRNVIDKAMELENSGVSAPLAIETSGHGALKENYFLDDGAYMAVRLISHAAKLRKEGKTLSDLIADLKEPECEECFRVTLTGENWKRLGQILIDDMRRYGKKSFEVKDNDYEGVRVYLGSDWFMLRQSVHDPVLVINFEGAKKQVCKMVKIVYDFLLDYDNIDPFDLDNLFKYK